MNKPRLIVPGLNLSPGEVSVGPAFARHAKVLRLAPGDEIVLCDGAGHEMRGRVVSLSSELLVVDLHEELALTSKEAPLRITLYQGIAKGEKMEWIIQKATELGVTRIVPVAMARSVAKYDKPPSRWEKIAQEAARQSERAYIPEIAPILRLTRVVLADSLPSPERGDREAVGEAVEGEAVRLLLDETGQGARLREVLPREAREVSLWVGPEGGTTPEERAMIVGAGFTPAYLGGRILRTETASIAMVAILQHYYGDLG